MITLVYKSIPYTLHYRAEKVSGLNIWKVTVNVRGKIFYRTSTDKDLFRRLSDLNSFNEIQEELDIAFFASFRTEIINYLDK
jgi:hypothetical protein